MGAMAQLFAGVNFRKTIHQYCARQSWPVADMNDRRAILRFSMASGREQTCFIIKYDSTLEFSVSSGLRFDSLDEAPHYISTLLLTRNREKKIGFWCLEEIGGRHVYSCMHNAEMELIHGDYFADIVETLIVECEEFEEEVLQS